VGWLWGKFFADSYFRQLLDGSNGFLLKPFAKSVEHFNGIVYGWQLYFRMRLKIDDHCGG
jgi:hypothetical protein